LKKIRYLRYLNSTELEEILQSTISDEHGIFGHPFVSRSKDDLYCEICSTKKEKHLHLEDGEASRVQSLFLQCLEEVKAGNFENQKLGEKGEICSICLLEVEKEMIHQIEKKPHGVCKYCFSLYLQNEIQNGQVEEIKCPHCDLKLSQEQIQELVDQITFEKYKKFLMNKQIQKNPLMR